MKDQITRRIDTICEHGEFVEIKADDISTEDLLSMPNLLDGFHLCPDCQDVFVLVRRGACASCKRINLEFETRRLQACKPVDQTDRLDMGILPFEPNYDPAKPASRLAVPLIFLGALATSMLTVTGFWFGLRGLIHLSVCC